MSDDLLRVAFVHFGLKDVHNLILSHRRQHVLCRPVAVVDLVLLLELQASSILLCNRVDRDGLVQRCRRELITLLVEGE